MLGKIVLYRLIYISEMVGPAGSSILSKAQILGVSERNNRRDDVTSGVMFHDGWCLHAVEGRRADIDRLLLLLREDPRHRNLRVVVDKPIAERLFHEPMALCHEPAAMLKEIGAGDLSAITAFEVERIVALKQAA